MIQGDPSGTGSAGTGYVSKMNSDLKFDKVCFSYGQLPVIQVSFLLIKIRMAKQAYHFGHVTQGMNVECYR
jgi:hypothetical protein